MKIWGSGIFLLFVFFGYAQDESNTYNLENGVALKGYDPVCYFKMNRAVKGKKEFAYRFQRVSYYFANSSDLENFQADPSKYLPQYGGWCAYAMGHNGTKVEVDPETFKIINGKLFLFYNRFFNNTLKSWNQDETSLHTRADANWQKFMHP
jgi:YHS domain-containing protein